MAQEAYARPKIPAKSPQPPRGRPVRQAKASRTAHGRMLTGGTGRAATRGGDPVIELECGITVYPARGEQGRWRAPEPAKYVPWEPVQQGGQERPVARVEPRPVVSNCRSSTAIW